MLKSFTMSLAVHSLPIHPVQGPKMQRAPSLGKTTSLGRRQTDKSAVQPWPFGPPLPNKG